MIKRRPKGDLLSTQPHRNIQGQSSFTKVFILQEHFKFIIKGLINVFHQHLGGI